MSKGNNQKGSSGPNSALGPGFPAHDFKLRSAQSLRPDRETGAPGADGILDALKAPDSKREVAA